MGISVHFEADEAGRVVTVGKVNEAGGVNKGQVVYISGASGNNILLKLADNTIHLASHVIGIADEDGDLNDFITVVRAGTIENIDTSSFTESPPVLHLITNGNMQSAIPTTGAHLHMAYTMKSNPTTGRILVCLEQYSHDMGATSGLDLEMSMGDTLGVNKISYQNFSHTEVAFLDSLGNFNFKDNRGINDDSQNEHIRFRKTASATTYMEFTNKTNGNGYELSVAGGGTNEDLILSRKGTGIVKGNYVPTGVRLIDSATAIAADTSIGGDWRLFGKAFTVTGVRAFVDTAPTGLLTIDINEAGTTILSTKLTIDANEKTSATAATPAVISDSSIAADAIMTFDVDSTTGGSGLVVYIDGYYT
jgi:hypothetical protein